jgi:hypothetical protein
MIRKRYLPQFQGMLSMLGITRTDGKALDSAETGFIAKQLEYVMAETYSVQYGPNLARLFVPIDTSVPAGAETFVYDQWDHIGLAKIITSWSDDLPKAEAFVKRFSAQMKSLGASYEFTVQDIRAIQFSRGRLNDERALAARMAIENAIDQIAAEGNADHGLKGLINHDAVPVVTPAYGAWSDTTAAASILFDLNKLDNAVVTNTRTLIKPDTRLFSTKDWGILQRPIGAEFSKTILQAYLTNSTYIKFADQWPSLDTAGEDGNSRTVSYKRDKIVASLVISIEFTQHPPQQRNLAFQVPCEARVGGVTMKYPLGMAYMDTHTTP